MAGFKKAKGVTQAALKIGVYGPHGSGKTFTALLWAEGLAKRSKKRIAWVDTETSTAFYRKRVAKRRVHPAAFDFDLLETKSLHETATEIRKLDSAKYDVVVIDSMTHMWDAARAAHGNGQVAPEDWATIKKPYKSLLAFLMDSPMHVILCMRQGLDYRKDYKSGEYEVVGVKPKAEIETPYEPHILIRMELNDVRGEAPIVTAIPEKDRSGLLSGHTFPWPSYETVIKPLLPLLGSKQASMPDEHAAALIDSEQIPKEDQAFAERSRRVYVHWRGRLNKAKTAAAATKTARKISDAVKATMTNEDHIKLRQHYRDTLKQFADAPPPDP